MSSRYDAIIIGTGIIGGAIGLELARRGSRTLNVDRFPAAGYGSTSDTCAIIRFHYSTADGVTMARESYYYWFDWPKHVGAPDEKGMAHYVNTGCLMHMGATRVGAPIWHTDCRPSGIARELIQGTTGVTRFSS